MIQFIAWLPTLLKFVSVISLFWSVSSGWDLVETQQVYMQAVESGDDDVSAPSIWQYIQTAVPALLTVGSWLVASKFGQDSTEAKVLDRLKQFIGKGGDPTGVIVGPSVVVPGPVPPSPPSGSVPAITRLQAIDALLSDLKTSDDEDTAIDLTITNGGKKRRLYYGPVAELVPPKATATKATK